MRIIALCLIHIFCFIQLSSFSQNSYLYTDNGKLIIDSTYSISNSCLQKVVEIEVPLINSVSNKIEYPRIASSNGVEGLVIAKITVSSNNIKVHIVKSVDNVLSDSFKKTLYELEKCIVGLFNLDNTREIQFYMPIEFRLLKNDCIANIKKYNKIIIVSSSGCPITENIGIRNKPAHQDMHKSR